MRRFCLALLTLFALTAKAAQAQEWLSPQLPADVPPMQFGEDILTITTAKGEFVYDVAVAISPEQGARGLMYVPALGANKGMLFLFPYERELAFWMKNTLIPLDIIFIDEDLKLVNVQENAEPLTTTSRPSTGPAKYVLEIDGGDAATLGIDAETVFDFGPKIDAFLAQFAN